MPGFPIRSIRLVQFRGFKRATLRLKRLTVLLGPNSAGKSSFGQALAALKQTHAAGEGEPDLGLSGAGRLVDLGDYDDLAHRRSRGGVGIDLELDPGDRWIELKFGGVDESGKLMRGLRPTGLKLPRDQSAIQQNVVGPPAASVKVQMEIPQITGELSKTTPMGVGADDFIRAKEEQWRTRSGAKTEDDLTTLVFKGLKLLSATGASTSSIVPYPRTALDLFTRSLATIEYLKPNRLQPERRYRPAPNKHDELGASGEWTPAFLYKHQRDLVDTLIPPECPKTPAQAAELLTTGHPWTTRRDTLVNALGHWVQRLGLGTGVKSTEEEGEFRLDIDGRGEHSQALPDLGFGVSQVLPVLVAGLVLNSEGLLIVEQPEAQLHPRPQAALADFFCALTKSGRSALVETHSEAFFHRLRLRAAMDPDLAKNIVVYFLHEPDANGVCCEPTEIRLDDDGVIEWPSGFLTDGIEEELSISAVRAAKSQRT